VPELPETETIARDLDAVIPGAVVGSVTVERHDVLRGIRAAELDRRLRGQRISAVTRRAKSIVIVIGDDRLVVTPRFTGALLLGLDAADADYDCLRLQLDGGRALRYRDVRRLGTVALLDQRAFDSWDHALGPDPLDPRLDAESFWRTLRASRRPVKAILMDQRRLAGVGNIYANEACWRARVRPARRGSTLTRQEGTILLDSLRTILTDSIALRGTTFRDYRDAHGGRGGYAARLQAYGRAGAPCPRCGAPIQVSHAIESRATFWCSAPGCQR
jgi:formamidopyrimidine-DNA glycosylase